MPPLTNAHLDHIADYQARLALTDIFELVGQLIERIARIEARLTTPAPPGPALLLPAADDPLLLPAPAPEPAAKPKPATRKTAP